MLNDYRNKIDAIDKALLDLYEQRMEVVKLVANYKHENKLPVLNANREKQVIENRLSLLKNKEISIEVVSLFKEIMQLSKNYEHRLINNYISNDFDFIDDSCTIAYYGCEGSYTHKAAINFNANCKKIGFSSFELVFEALNNREISYIVLPIENSSTGGIHNVYDGLFKYDSNICGETYVKIDHNLIGLPDSKIDEIQEIFSHLQGFEQCQLFLNKYPNIKLSPYNSTGESVALISKLKDKSKAAIGSSLAAKLNDLSIIVPNINSIDENYTRFILISKKIMDKDDFNKISIVLSLEHKTGSLYHILSLFERFKLNLEKIESRPNLRTPFQYNFYIDFNGNMQSENVISLFESLKSSSIKFTILGHYKKVDFNI